MKALAAGRPTRALVVAPHPDDEAIGAWGLIRLLRRRGTHVAVLVASDGGASHPSSKRWPRARLVAERRRETRRVLRRIGVAAGAVRFLGLRDGELERGAVAARRAVGRAIVQARSQLLVMPVGDDAHPDHRVVAAVRGQAQRRLGYLVWPGQRAPRGGTRRLPLGSARVAKRAAIGRYRTQMGAIRDDPAGFVIARHELARFARPCELFREERR